MLSAAPDTKAAILAVARRKAQAHGYAGLSFRELAKEVGIKSASLHYHFPTKGDLGAAVAHRYAEDAARIVNELLASTADPVVLVRAFTDVFRAALENDNRMCLYGILSAERAELPPAVRLEVERFAEVCVGFLTKVVVLGGASEEAAERRARAMFAAIEGAQLVARGRGDVGVYDEILATYRSAGLLP